MNFPNFQALADELNKQAGRIVVDPNNPTYEGQQLVNKWLETNKKTPQNPDGYDVPEGGNTDKYLKAPTERPPADTVNPPADVPPTTQTETNSSEEDTSTQPTKPQNQKSAIQNIPGSILAGWTPIVASSVLNTVDPSGQAAGWRNQAALYAQNAAENAKIMQWNKQRATDNTLADKVAAAQAHEKWQQNANSMGAEGSAGTVAGTLTAVTPDKMAEKNFQQQAMNTASQNLAEVNRNKLEASAANTDANVEDWQVNYNQQLDAEASNLSEATGAKKNDTVERKDTEETTEKKDTEKKDTEKNDTEETTDKPDTKAEDAPKSVAPSNQASDATQDATTQTAADKEMSDIITQATQIVEGFKNGEVTSNQASVEQEYEQLKQKYQALIDKGVISNPPEFPKMETPSSLFTSEDDTQKNIVNTISSLR